MLNQASFIDCIRDQLEQRGFGKNRTDELIARYKGLQSQFEQAGHNASDAAVLASNRLFDELSNARKEKGKRLFKTLAVQAANAERIAQAADVDTSRFALDGGGGEGAKYARAAISVIEDDPRFSGTSYSTAKETVRGQLYAIMSDVLEKLGKGAFGTQRGQAHLPNVVRELFGENTGDKLAREFATAYTKTQGVAVDLFNTVGGSMNKLDNYRLPQAQSAAKVVKAGEARWVEAHMRALDWSKMAFPDGSPIPPQDRERVLKFVYSTIATNGAVKIDEAAVRGRGRAIGNALEKHRFMIYKDAASWLAAHEEFGDGNVFDVIVRHIDDMAHKIAAVETFGPTPELARQNLHALVRKYASEKGGKAVAEAEALMNNRFDPMFETAMRQNPMDPNSNFGALVVGTSNILTAAQLGSAALLAIPGDFMQTAMVRALNRMNVLGGVDFYLKSIATDRAFMTKIAAQSGFVMDEAVMSTYAAQRFTGLSTIGPQVSRRVSDSVMRLSLLSGHTRAARWSVQAEFMGLMSRASNDTFDKLPFRAVMERYGITPDEWDAFRSNVFPWQPRKDVDFLRPIDILQTKLPNKEALYRKFQGMVFEESRKMVPESTIEGSVFLKDTTRPDTLAGALLHSFAMYKNFPVSFMMIYGRLALSNPDRMTRLAFIAGLGASMTLVGALGTQLREVARGRDPLPMDTPQFWGKAFLSGGAFSIWGDFLFTGINEYGHGPAQAAAGPLAGFLGDTTQLAFGDVFQFAEVVGGLGDKDFNSTTAAKAVEWARRYTPGSSVWWARLALERSVFDRLQELADPKAYQKQQRKVRKQERDFGNQYWWAPGEVAPDRAPGFSGG